MPTTPIHATPDAAARPAWPASVVDLVRAQEALGSAAPEPAPVSGVPSAVGACFVCFARGGSGPGSAGDPGWAAAVVMRGRRVLHRATTDGAAGAPYLPGLLALREGPLLETAVRGLAAPPDVLLVNASGRDHPRRAGLALHLGAVLGIPTVGVTDRVLVAQGGWPGDEQGATAPLLLGDEVVGHRVRTRGGARPVAVNAGWRIDPDAAVEVVLSVTRRARTPEPLREARRLARRARAEAARQPDATAEGWTRSPQDRYEQPLVAPQELQA